MADNCQLCEAERLTEWLFEDEEIWIAECIVCLTPMVVWKQHGLPEETLEQAFLERFKLIASQRYPHGWWLDTKRRRIPEHWHAHARPAGAFFDPRSDLDGEWDEAVDEEADPV